MIDPVPAEMVQRLTDMARQFRESGREPVVPRNAATVVLLREDRSVFLIRRLRAMAFGGMWAFPGGALEAGETPAQAAVRELYEETGVLIEEAALTPWHRWLTPVFEPRRFDTWFYLAPLPPGAIPVLPEGEADQAQWLTLEAAIEANTRGDLPMLPPTLFTLVELSTHDTVASMLAAVRDVSSPYMPEF